MRTIKHPGYFMHNELDLPRDEWKRHVEYRKATGQIEMPAAEWFKAWSNCKLEDAAQTDRDAALSRVVHYTGFMDAITVVLDSTCEILANAAYDSVGDEDLGHQDFHSWN